MKHASLALNFIFMLFLASCSSKMPYSRDIDTFNTNQKEFDRAVNYIEKKYINVSDRSNLARKSILICGDNFGFDSADYRFCDSHLKKFMIKFNISVINIEKNKCFENRNFDLISFNILDSNSETENFYRYSYCDDNITKIKRKNFEVIPLNEKWFFFVEK